MSPEATSVETIIDSHMQRARSAMREVAEWGQDEIDLAVRALAWSVYEDSAASELAELAVETTGLGNIADKVRKNKRKTIGTLRDLLRLPSVGVVDTATEQGIVKIAKPVGVVASMTPSTNPAATPINNAMMAVNGANAIIFAPSPAGWATTARVVEFARTALRSIGGPEDLVQVLPQPVSRDLTGALMQAADLVIATGAQENVRAAYRSGTPAIGVGAGNVPVIIDSSADLADASAKITASKTFDNATSCSAENSLIILDDIYDAAIAALESAGGHLLEPERVDDIRLRLFPGGDLDRAVIAKDYDVLCEHLSVKPRPAGQFLLLELEQVDATEPLCGEKLSLVTTVFRASSIEEAVGLSAELLRVQGMGHSAGIHSHNRDSIDLAARHLNVARLLINQAHAVGNGGSFDNALPFSLSMGCGTWGKNSICENLSGKHFLNYTRVVSTIPTDLPSEQELFNPLWSHPGHPGA